jgi:hypothetical protein
MNADRSIWTCEKTAPAVPLCRSPGAPSASWRVLRPSGDCRITFRVFPTRSCTGQVHEWVRPAYPLIKCVSLYGRQGAHRAPLREHRVIRSRARWWPCVSALTKPTRQPCLQDTQSLQSSCHSPSSSDSDAGPFDPKLPNESLFISGPALIFAFALESG